MEDSGFGLFFQSANQKMVEDLNLNSLEFNPAPINPIFNFVEDTTIRIEEIPTLEKCLCSRFRYAGKPVLPSGDSNSKFVFVVDQPDEYETTTGNVFEKLTREENPIEKTVMFEEILQTLSLKREKVYITNIVYCRDEKRDLTPECLYSCMKFKKQEFSKLVNAKYIFALGTNVISAMTGIFGATSQFVGNYFNFQLHGHEAYLIPLASPMFMLMDEKVKERNFRVLKSLIK